MCSGSVAELQLNWNRKMYEYFSEQSNYKKPKNKICKVIRKVNNLVLKCRKRFWILQRPGMYSSWYWKKHTVPLLRKWTYETTTEKFNSEGKIDHEKWIRFSVQFSLIPQTKGRTFQINVNVLKQDNLAVKKIWIKEVQIWNWKCENLFIWNFIIKGIININFNF